MSAYCSQCGQAIRQGTVYCPQCGKVVDGSSSTFFHGTHRQTIHEDFKTIVCEEPITQIDLSCKVLNVSVMSANLDAVRITWGETGSWGVAVEQSNGHLHIRERNYLGFQNISDVFLSEKHKQVHVQVPNDYNGSITLSTDTGKIELVGIATNEAIHVTSSAGWIDVVNVKSDESVFIKNAVGKISASNLHAEQDLSLSTTVGGISARRIGTGNRIFLTAQTGSIDCTVADNKENFKTIRRTGSFESPQTDIHGNGSKILETSVIMGNVNIAFDGQETQKAT
ncbi:MAG: DUF4097 family beta strand repeat-containing protein [Suipraeoptans sp.]